MIPMSLTEVCGGAVIEQFNAAVREVKRSYDDPEHYQEGGRRTITIRICFERPEPSRPIVVEAQVKTLLPPAPIHVETGEVAKGGMMIEGQGRLGLGGDTQEKSDFDKTTGAGLRKLAESGAPLETPSKHPVVVTSEQAKAKKALKKEKA